MRRYVFSEFTSFTRLSSDETIAALLEHGLTVYVAATRAQVDEVAAVANHFRAAGVGFGLWPLLDDDRGRWASAWNGVEFADGCRSILAALEAAGARPDEVILDLEPPIELTKQALRGRFGRVSRPDPGGVTELAELVERIRDTVGVVSAAVAPWAACGGGRRGWQRLMGTPVDDLAFERVFVMAYTSLIEGYSRGVLTREHAEALLGHWSARANEQFGERAAIAVGVVGVGALGDERIYRNHQELERDVAICRGAGVEHVALFNLRGALDRGSSSWFEALRTSRCVDAPPPSKRVRAILAALRGTGQVAALLP